MISPKLVDPVVDHKQDGDMLTARRRPSRTLALCCQGHHAIALENLSLRQQLAVSKCPY